MPTPLEQIEVELLISIDGFVNGGSRQIDKKLAQMQELAQRFDLGALPRHRGLNYVSIMDAMTLTGRPHEILRMLKRLERATWKLDLDPGYKSVATRFVSEQTQQAWMQHRQQLSYREQRILERRFGLDGSLPSELAPLGRTWNLTFQRVEQIERQAIAKLLALQRAEDPSKQGNPSL